MSKGLLHCYHVAYLRVKIEWPPENISSSSSIISNCCKKVKTVGGAKGLIYHGLVPKRLTSNISIFANSPINNK